MGRTKRLSNRVRSSPLPAADQEQLEVIIPVIDKLSCPNATERAWAAACVSNLVTTNETTRKLLLSKGLTKKLIDRLTDNVHGVVVEAVGALRNLAVTCGDDACIELYNADVLTPLMALMSQTSTAIEKSLLNVDTQSANDQIDSVVIDPKCAWDLAENIIYIISALCESSSNALVAVNNMNILPFLMSFFTQSNKIPVKPVLAAAQCLYTITDEYEDLCMRFNDNPQYVNLLSSVINTAERDYVKPQQYDEYIWLLVRVLACGILSNLGPKLQSSAIIGDATTEIKKMTLPLLLSCLDIDLQQIASEVVSDALEAARTDANFIITSNNNTEVTREESSMSAMDLEKPKSCDKLFEKLAAIETRLTITQRALELVAKICSESSPNADEDSWNPSDDENEEQPQDNDDAMSTDSIKSSASVSRVLLDSATLDTNYSRTLTDLSSASLSIFTTLAHDLTPKLIALSTPTSISFSDTAPDAVRIHHRKIITMMSTTHLRAVECLNNFLLTVVEVVGGLKWFEERKFEIEELWVCLIQRLRECIGGRDSLEKVLGATKENEDMQGEWLEERRNLIETLIGCAWSVARGLKGYVPVSESEINEFVNWYLITRSDSLRVKIIGTLGTIARRQNAIEANRVIGNFLISVLQLLLTDGSTPTDCAVEALNAIYDIYADIEYDYDRPVFIDGGYLEVLKGLVGTVGKMAKSIDKRKARDQRLRADEAYENLIAFIKYKENERNTA